MADRAYAKSVDDRADKMLTEYTVEADRIYAEVYSRLRK